MGPWILAFTVGGLNMAVAPILAAVTSTERHMTKANASLSLILKLLVTRGFISVVLVRWLSPFLETLHMQRIASIRDVIIVDSFLKPAVQFLDMQGLFDHYITSMFATVRQLCISCIRLCRCGV